MPGTENTNHEPNLLFRSTNHVGVGFTVLKLFTDLRFRNTWIHNVLAFQFANYNLQIKKRIGLHVLDC